MRDFYKWIKTHQPEVLAIYRREIKERDGVAGYTSAYIEMKILASFAMNIVNGATYTDINPRVLLNFIAQRHNGKKSRQYRALEAVYAAYCSETANDAVNRTKVCEAFCKAQCPYTWDICDKKENCEFYNDFIKALDGEE